MSTVRANSYLDASGGSNAQLYGVASPPNSMGFRNRIINGDCRVDQRNNGAAVTYGAGPTPSNVFGYNLDRWWAQSFSQAAGNGATFTVQRNAGNVTPPAGFTNYLGVTVTYPQSTLQSDSVYRILQPVEGLNMSDFGWGTASAQSVTLSFWVRSSTTGLFSGTLANNFATAGPVNNRYIFTFTINAANTWEYKTISIPGATAGTWRSDNGIGIELYFVLGAFSSRLGTPGAWGTGDQQGATGTTNLMATNGATFYITGVQLEAGTVASAFERRDYGRELMMCQRYYVGANGVSYFTAGYDASYTTFNSGGLSWDYQMRATPTISIVSGGMDGHHAVAPTVRSGPTYYGVGLQFSGSGLRTNSNCSAYVTYTLSAEL